ncbi:MAG: SGNH/GDSL hydrolase family protein [Candidatus Methylacidiphilales bacterium]
MPTGTPREAISFNGPLSWRPVYHTSRGWRSRPIARPRIEFVSRFYRQVRSGRTGIVVEGDSWFRNPLVTDVIDHLEASGKYAISRSDVPGRTLREMAVQKHFLSRLRDPHSRDSVKCLLLSGGGNDMLDDKILPVHILKKNTSGTAALDFFNQEGHEKILKKVLDDLLYLVAAVQKIKPKLPIITHTYDYPIPRNAAAHFHKGFQLIKAGPWIYRAMQKNKIPAAYGSDIAKKLIDDFHDRVLEPARNQFPHVLHIVNLRGVLGGDVNLWDDEIHPTGEGFERIARRLIAAIEKHRLP